ncbi:sugar ABC transporter ATP-binding protein [Anaerosacchariphilus polymeriproducens]|uniref:Sugar ABC transporter ATP-binding protein n=2 Tax=Anaerosacchariphilus polymeriproducens TaxID=1812858 RepID=A0A371AVL0_9FIRM|nr:sugar ABC transporter ATP-binding protein [Anaerosacchariphilus polymeriproducens]
MRDINKYFVGAHALDNCCFTLQKGEIHALVGENGAGKSTLVKIMTGVYTDYDGEYLFCGNKVHFQGIKEAQQAGISVVHQELNMMNDLTVAQNIFIGRESKGFFCSDKKLNEKAQKLISDFDIKVKPTELLKNLSVGKAQMVEIARAMSFESTKVLILDEPTAALSESESHDLFEKMENLRKKGISIVFISHRLGEIMKIADRVTVMRDGAYIDTLKVCECKIEEIICLMIGREIIEEPKQRSGVKENAPTVLEVTNLKSSKVKDVSFILNKGEILGFAGLVGSGRTEVMRLIYGVDKKESGEIFVNGVKRQINHSKDAIKYGIGYLSEDRKRFGLMLGLSVMDNIVLPSYTKLSKFGFVSKKKCLSETYRLIKQLKIKTFDTNQIVKKLSGGNQQKVVIGKWLLQDMDILIFDEPTRGIDVGAREEIYIMIKKLINQGNSIIVISSDLTEIVRLSDRVMVMSEGKITGELDISEANQEKIMTLATQG